MPAEEPRRRGRQLRVGTGLEQGALPLLVSSPKRTQRQPWTMHQDGYYPPPSPLVNGSLDQEPLRQLPDMSPRGGGGGLPLLAAITAAFVLLAICIVLVVRLGPTLHQGRATLLTEPPALKPENGIYLIHWRLLSLQDSHRESQQGLFIPHSGPALEGHRSSIDEVTYL